ncbi:BGTF surface domain-containing protein [Halorientalis pallida]|uniref:DUF7282 domain-containing protein n=1 Tax=Halorientalis pallida TaxID=2479928 RepID=A0A498L0L4_9EURY|nr:BGTF surface domain-containing protein [Halorientalis pallida]RXK46926.1 hypothetical protein EAF64_17420 [Halorientalis pallida]
MGVRSDKLRGLCLLALLVIATVAGTAGTVGSTTAANDEVTATATPDEPTSSPTPDEPTSSPTPDEPTSSPTPDEPTSSPTPDEPTSSPTPDEPTSSPTPDGPAPLKATFSPGVAAQNTTVLELSRSEGRHNVTVTADGLDAETIRELLAEQKDAFINEGGRVEFRVIEKTPSINVDFSSIQAGTYEFEFTVKGTREAATATVRVISPNNSSPESVTSASPTFVGGKIKVTRGGVAKIPIRTRVSTRMKVHIASNSGGYSGSFTIRNGREDDIIRLRLNTFTLGRYGNQYEAGIRGTAVSAASTVSSDDKILSGQLNQSTPLLNSVDPGTYTLRISVDGKQTDKSSLEIKPLSNTRVWTQTAPQQEFDEYYTASDVRSAVMDEYDREAIAVGDVLVIGIYKSGLSGVLSTGDDPLQQLLAHNASAFSLTIRQQNPKNNQTAKILDLRETIRRDRLELFSDEKNEVVYLLGRTNKLIFHDGQAKNKNTLVAGDQFSAELTLLKSGSLVEADKTSETTFEAVKRVVDFQYKSNMITVQSEFDQSIKGSTSVAPGTELEIQAKSKGADPFLKRTTAEVTPEQTFESTFDFNDVSQNITFRLNMTDIPNEDTVGIVGDALRASVSFDKQQIQTDAISISSVRLSHGGYLALRNGSSSGAVVGISGKLTPGRHDDIRVPVRKEWNGSKTLVAVPYYNISEAKPTNVRQSDIVYRQDGSAVSDTATITKPSQGADTLENGTGGHQANRTVAANISEPTATAPESLIPADPSELTPAASSDDRSLVATSADPAGPGLADLSVAAYGVVALGLLVVFVVVRE